MDFVKFGIIGAGSAWGFHRAGCRDSTVAKFVAVYDVNIKNAERMAKQYRINEMRVFSDLDEFLNSDIDAVLITVPHVYHESLVIAAAAAGKHVLCEKPMATTLEGCDQMINATKSAGVKLMIAENHRFLPAHQYIHDAIQQNLIGDIALIRAYEGVNEIPGLSQSGFWKGDPVKAGGGALMDMGAHKFATLEWILDDQVESISATLAKQCTTLPEKAEDNALAIVRFKKGTIAEVVVSFTQIPPPYNSLEIHGTKGSILENHNWEHPVRINSTDAKMAEYRNVWFEPEIEHGIYPFYYTISFRCEDEYFANCIIEDRDPEFTPEQARSAIADILMGYISAKAGKSATRADLMQIYESRGTNSILENLNEFVPINQNLSKG
jgi:predicted dehydrogenase